jgi:molecular chaperone HtpG
MDDAEQLLPVYLRFVRGVIDSNDLPLNVSREILQESRDVRTIREGSTKRVLALLEDLAGNRKEDYARFWLEFGQVLKEGVGEDAANRDRIVKLLRFVSTSSDGAATVSLPDYVGRFKPEQKEIYYVTGDTPEAARNSPHLEIFRKKGVEVLLLTDRVDEWVIGMVREFQGKPLRDAARGEFEPLKGAAVDGGRSEEQRKNDKSLCRRVKAVLGEEVAEVRASLRLQESPACLVRPEGEPSPQLRRMLEASGQNWPAAKPVLELNMGHALLRHLDGLGDAAAFAELTRVLYEQALLTEDGTLADPGAFARRLSGLLVRLVGAGPGQ